jgi:hypothetical protein
MPTTRPVPPNSLDKALDYVAKGGRLVIRTAWRATVIDQKLVGKFRKVDAWLLKEDGNGYRMRRGMKSSVYLFPGQLEFVIED